MSIDITAVVNLHREGASALPSIISAWRAVEAARHHGLNCTLVLALDRSDRETAATAERWEPRGANIIEIDEGDLGQARNRAGEAADSTWLAYLDADDLWGEAWLWRAHAEASANSVRLTVWHPALNIIFGDHHSVVHHVDSTDASFSWSRFRLHNQWTALSFVRRHDLLNVPYPRNDLEKGFGFEDWSWNEEVLRRGGQHRIVPDTCHFIHRSEKPSLLSSSQHALRTRYPAAPGVTYHLRPVEQITAESDNPATHEVTPLDLSQELRQQVRSASTIEPRVLATVDPASADSVLPQNFQRHVTPLHAALHELSLTQHATADEATIAELLHTSSRVHQLESSDRTFVVAEVLLDPELSTRSWGESPLISEAIDRYPQLVRRPD